MILVFRWNEHSVVIAKINTVFSNLYLQSSDDEIDQQLPKEVVEAIAKGKDCFRKKRWGLQ